MDAIFRSTPSIDAMGTGKSVRKLYARRAAGMGVAMAEWSSWTARGAEISERSTDLVLPEDLPCEAQAQRNPQAARAEGGEFVQQPEARQSEWSRAELSGPSPDAESEERRAGIALPGDRGPRSRYERPSERRDGSPAATASSPRPSFWRRIALGRRASAATESASPSASPSTSTSASTSTATRSPEPTGSSTSPARSQKSLVEAGPVGAREVENRIVEPMLQALVSVEAKLERSHLELMGRSDQVEQRLSQLWDIEEQLGALTELQDSLLRVSEQQRRLEAAIQSQTRTARWLVGAVFASLAAAAFVVAAVLR